MKGLLWAAAILGILIGGLRLTALRWWQVPIDDAELGASLAPTLHAGDWILLWRLTPPSFGDLVVCPDPHNDGYHVIGRFAAEGDDKIVLTGSDVTVNRKKLPTESACSPSTHKIEDPVSGATVPLYCATEVMGGVTHMRLATKKKSEFATEVPPGRVFLLSDNRDMPFDSRHYGTLEGDTCKETVFFRIMGAKGLGDVDTRFTFIR